MLSGMVKERKKGNYESENADDVGIVNVQTNVRGYNQAFNITIDEGN